MPMPLAIRSVEFCSIKNDDGHIDHDQDSGHPCDCWLFLRSAICKMKTGHCNVVSVSSLGTTGDYFRSYGDGTSEPCETRAVARFVVGVFERSGLGSGAMGWEG